METASVSRALFRIFVPAWSSLGLSANAMIKRSMTMDISFRRQTMLNDIKFFGGLTRMMQTFKEYSPDVQIPDKFFSTADLEAGYKYRVFGSAKVKDNLTGKTFFKDISMYTDENRGVAGWADDYRGMNPTSDSDPSVTLLDVTVNTAIKNSVWKD